ncbi:AMP-binding protein [Nocardioides coralli]|uniref:AMP-binding protein n=1 Tax=Nocardioides coralli TaxID=2872154 RepID=UPI001CA43F9A|nr:AMP-binding protein [Nocardioides coralli]QZY28980.1 AMP-binding protein [Nocardioides coralli]
MDPSCFDALDRHVIGGGADRVALDAPGRRWTYAQLLEEVAAFGGVLKHCGAGPGRRVAVALPDGPDRVVAVLACARIGATYDLGDDPGDAPVVVTASSQTRTAEAIAAAATPPEAVVVRHDEGSAWPLSGPHDLDWDVVMRAGRTDPAPCADGATVSPYDATTRAWLEPLLAGETLTVP